ncbi:uncharacterized protein [Aristolochia californica]|uniref:uncharacterized protein n=1 Tax=Aristolochia californica TaxID=171875 RepID=UPI0035E2633C
MYLRCFVGDSPKRCVRWLAWAEFCYNTSYHRALGTTPFKVIYGRDPPWLLSYEPGSSKVTTMDQALAKRDTMLSQVRTHLQAAQKAMKLSYDKNHLEVVFSPRDYVWLFAYHLQLPPDAKLHNIFHISQLKGFNGDSPLLHTPLPSLQEGRVLSTPAQVLQARRIQGD